MPKAIGKTTQEEPSVSSPDLEAPKERAAVGASISIRGEVRGKEDLVIHGQVEGQLVFDHHNVEIGKKGRVKADIVAKTIRVEGEVQGNLKGEDKISVLRSGRIRGNITAPRVNLEDGAKFKGSIDMDSHETPPGIPGKPASSGSN